MRIYTHPTKNDFTAWAPIRLAGANKIWGPGIDLRTPLENFLSEALGASVLQKKGLQIFSGDIQERTTKKGFANFPQDLWRFSTKF